MDQIITFISAKLGISESVARKALTVVLQFARKKASGTEFESLLAKIPGAADLVGDAPPAEEAPGGLGGLLGGLGSLGGSAADAAKALSGLQGAGLETSQIGPFLQAFVEKGREVAGPETMDAMLDKIPALKGFVTPAA